MKEPVPNLICMKIKSKKDQPVRPHDESVMWCETEMF